jgi:hypothetical protein
MRPPLLLNDTVDGGKAQAGSVALGCEKRLKQMRLNLLAHPASGIRDGQPQCSGAIPVSREAYSSSSSILEERIVMSPPAGIASIAFIR